MGRSMPARLVATGAAATLLVVGAGVVARRTAWLHGTDATSLPSASIEPALVKVKAVAPVASPSEPPGPPAALAGIDLTRVRFDDEGALAPLPNGRTARLTLDPELQRTASTLLRSHHFVEASVVMMDPLTGEVLAYASYAEGAPARDLAVVASAPAASVFKIVTGAALVGSGGLTPESRHCYSGGEQRISAADLVADERRDRWCVTLAGAMGRSVNTVFARLAQKHLTVDVLEEQAHAFGFGAPVPFDVPVEPSELKLPADALGFARTAAGFWNTTLSPLEAAWMSAVVARGGDAPRPFVVREARGADKEVVYSAPAPSVVRRALSADVAQALTTMMEATVSDGTCFKAFHDRTGTSFLPGVTVAGKTGTLADAKEQKLYTWFTGFAPAKPMPGVRQVAIGVLVANRPHWHLKANSVARELFRTHFAAMKVPGVTRPLMPSVTHRYDSPSVRGRKRAPR
jgi:cell division protein FtsI/penicillin-binding protein 2